MAALALATATTTATATADAMATHLKIQLSSLCTYYTQLSKDIKIKDYETKRNFWLTKLFNFMLFHCNISGKLYVILATQEFSV